MDAHNEQITGLILAGGRGRRMGGEDKGLLPIAGRPAVEYAIERLGPQVDHLIINANRNLPTYRSYGYEVVADEGADFAGPLAGVAAGMQAADTGYLLTAPCDCPWLPLDLASRLLAAKSARNADLATVETGDGLQPVFSLLETDILDSLMNYLTQGGRKIDRWFAHHLMALAYFSDCPEAFTNINTPEERSAAEPALGALAKDRSI